MTREQLLTALGRSATDIVRDLEEFSESAQILSSNQPRLIDQYPQQWVGIYQGKVAACGKSIKSVLSQADEKGIPHDKMIVRFIDRDEITLIL